MALRWGRKHWKAIYQRQDVFKSDLPSENSEKLCGLRKKYIFHLCPAALKPFFTEKILFYVFRLLSSRKTSFASPNNNNVVSDEMSSGYHVWVAEVN